jgi:hypothetical protein
MIEIVQRIAFILPSRPPMVRGLDGERLRPRGAGQVRTSSHLGEKIRVGALQPIAAVAGQVISLAAIV